MFGAALPYDPGHAVTLGFDLAAEPGLRQAQLVSGGEILSTRAFADAPRATHLDFTVQPHGAAWYALIVEDQSGRKAYTNPVWVGP